MKKEQKEKILNGSFELLKESAGLLGKVLKENYDDCTEKDLLEKIFVNNNVHFSTLETLLFNITRLLVEIKEDDK